ncbi:MAG: hypothetical protein ACREFF_07800 [Candidatus Udaeobacter sp.]
MKIILLLSIMLLSACAMTPAQRQALINDTAAAATSINASYAK